MHSFMVFFNLLKVSQMNIQTQYMHTARGFNIKIRHSPIFCSQVRILSPPRILSFERISAN